MIQVNVSSFGVFLCFLILAFNNDATTDGLSIILSPLPTILMSRRLWLTGSAGQIFSLVTNISSSNSAASGNDELPSIVRGISLAPLGKPQRFQNKTLNLSLEELANRLTNDLILGASGEGGYFLTGDLSLDIFKDDCVFSDPTNQVASLSRYQNALKILFDPAVSQVQLVSPLVINEQKKTISGRIRSRGYLKLPWKPFVSAYETDIVYTIDGTTGLISQQDQVWDSKSTYKALKETFTPSILDPPPMSQQMEPTPSGLEPIEVTKLFQYTNGRRPNEYTNQERQEIAKLIDIIVTNNDNSNDFRSELFPGRWIVAYLQPGAGGGLIDRRIPYPEFDFNDNFQVFGSDKTITNIGQVLGPWVDVKVSGTLQEEDPTSTKVPKRFRAVIEGGKLCILDDNCIGLPIKGEGIFSSLYLGDRLRIGQNINGGGARVIQIRL
mmetsp:Transcript_4853/g.5397  ORF Transcript_4853/g.5397 Transcript_4853/m.5397 type:complete len:439 (-) Transcript_4853:95-1411(-)